MSRQLFLFIVIISVGCQSQQYSPPREAAAHEQPAKIALRDGLGQVNFPISTSRPEAQQFFNQGMAYTYGFNHDAARRSFERAAQIDPNCAMAYWGQALVIGPNYNIPDVDRAAIKKAYDL